MWSMHPESDAEDENEQLRDAVAEIMNHSSVCVERHTNDTATLHLTHRVVESVVASQQHAPTTSDARKPAPTSLSETHDPWSWHPKNKILNNDGSKMTDQLFNYCWYQNAENVDAKAHHLQVLPNWSRKRIYWQALDFEMQETVKEHWIDKKHLYTATAVKQKKNYYYNVTIMCAEAPDEADSQQWRQTIQGLKEQYEWIQWSEQE